ncbi:MAG: cytochrome b/b6 domain-containing protein [Proteobacteria bacterium]|nr:cytochrome b/b6 domain-containing protein [Pseudomonadota bacterium]
MNDKNQIIVWDLLVRVFHWSLVLLIFLAYVTGESKGTLHKNIGLAVLAIVVVRIIWGFCGSKYARFSDFICSPVKALVYLRELATGKPTHYTGHNPAAAWMILFLLLGSIVICLSGYVAHTNKKANHSSGIDATYSIVATAYADQEKHDKHNGKHKRRARHAEEEKEEDEGDSVWSDIHEISAQLMLILICFHILGVAASSKMHNENLMKSMLTGKKDL